NLKLVCSSTGRTCLAVWRISSRRFEYQVIRDRVPAQRGAVELDRTFDHVAITDDERVAVTGQGPRVDVMELGTKQRRMLALPTDAECHSDAQGISWSAAGLYVTLLCEDTGRSRIYRFTSELKGPTLIHDSDRYIGGLAASDQGGLFMARRLFS